MSTRGLLTAALALISAWGAWLTLTVLQGRLPADWARRSLRAPPTAVPAGRSDCDCSEPRAAAQVTMPAGTAAAAATRAAERFTVCGREEAPPALAELPGLGSGSVRLAVHCGGSVHVIAVEAGGAGDLTPRRVVQLTASSASPAESLRAVTPITADLDGDTRVDLLVPVLLVDAQGSPRGGSLQRLRARPEGGFDPAARVIELAPGAVAAAKLDDQPGTDLALLQLGATQLDRAGELWTVRGGPAPLRTSVRQAGLGAQALAVADLDRDGFDDVAVASERESKVRLFRARDGVTGEATVWPLPGVREALRADLDGDGAGDLVLVGARVWVVLARTGEDSAPRELAASDGLREVHALDVDHDGRLDLVGYSHPAIVALLQTGALAFERRTVAVLTGEAGVFSARLAELGGAEAADAWIVTLSSGSEPAVEIALARDIALGTSIALDPRAKPLLDAPLIERFALR